MGEKPNIASISATNSVEMAFGEIITNLSSVYIGDVSKNQIICKLDGQFIRKKRTFQFISSC